MTPFYLKICNFNCISAHLNYCLFQGLQNYMCEKVLLWMSNCDECEDFIAVPIFERNLFSSNFLPKIVTLFVPRKLFCYVQYTLLTQEQRGKHKSAIFC
jgi:hypothetical protein